MFGGLPQAAVNPQWNPRVMLQNLKVPVVFTIGGKDPWPPFCQEKVDWIRAEDYFYAENGVHYPDRNDPQLGKQVFKQMLTYLE
ncbi:MAG: hypothetical protein HOE30_20645 [Deltaproteobacteria bacterium]|jgi:hypothetical protein|nr:hypothetical protein [Deltaproteobacteria bacterium]MBT4266447.1 hypothetical protein [Deltaproteobacteria bacterium]MBT6499396.1 hypothetical protein [Deltaproteobacteria bacterium]MBT7155341.1 hypothetical protein [Deltaproteobacteria bacterium]MBT7715017.1 hypothetical protein [Deltaproteobacteria bacterium]